MKKIYYTWQQIEFLLHEVMRSMKGWQPDYVVGIVRGGCFPAGLYSHYTGVPMYALKVQLADGVGEHTEDDTECNAWMSEDAYNGKNILIFDDINDSGKTLNWVLADWMNSTKPDDVDTWNTRINKSVRTACLIHCNTSDLELTYQGEELNKVDDPQWIVFPWEEWWKKNFFTL